MDLASTVPPNAPSEPRSRPLAGGVLMPGFAGTELPDWVAVRLRAGLASVCLYGPNITSAAQLRTLTAAIRSCNPDVLIAVDEEGGDVTRLHYDVGSPSPGNAWLGRLDDEATTERVGAGIAAELRAVGCNLNLAPCADVNANSDNPVIGVRSFGAAAELVARHTAAWVRGHQAAGVAACVKHFPGHGDTSVDSHLSLPVVDLDADDLARRDLLPFARSIAADAWSVMTSHILLPRIDADEPATMSSRVLGSMLRDELGFEGVVVSDALDMAGASAAIGIPEAAVRALIAGCDLLCIGPDNTDEQIEEIGQAIDDAVDSRRLPAARLASAVSRVAALSDRVAPPAEHGDPVQAPPTFGLDEIARQFEVGAKVRAAISEVGAGSWTVVCLETTRNIAAGVAPWGPSAAVAAGDAAWSGDIRSVSEHTASSAIEVEAPGAFLVGQANHRHSWVRELVDRRRSVGPTVVVDMGWPSDDRRYADVATFGASRLLGASLLQTLEQLVREPGPAR
ncbi:MAG TPA: beta-N-acetylhexosaminidase [Nocardioidaceae bacterium]|nr:beta-N-acetylhexosaminidase [Nocardioidaceae bacterium]